MNVLIFQKMNLVATLMMSQGIFSAWTGARDQDGSDQYEFIGDGRTTSATVWAHGEPNHPSGDCVFIVRTTAKLTVGNCGNTLHYICEVFP